ncbi:TrkA C-terminal domain-containing protein [Candidatus Woesearchaeota archaeon]|nr:TrkA C-terminal domain-containing protein [Candidatus Woesearchaeota archaeon]
MLALITFLAIVFFSIISVKLGTIALETTGLSRDIAAFQAQSAFSGVGFTTSESETVMSNPVRRKILRFMMLVGSAGLTTAVATLIITFVNTTPTRVVFGKEVNTIAFNVGLLVGGLILISFIFTRNWFENLIKWILAKPLSHLKSRIKLYDYEKILGLSEGYTIGSFEVPKHHWMVNKTISDLEMEKEGVIILGVYRTVKDKEQYLGIPSPDFKIHNRDKIMVYCSEEKLLDLAKREKGAKGAVERKEAIEEHKEMNVVKKVYERKLMEAAKGKGES